MINQYIELPSTTYKPGGVTDRLIDADFAPCKEDSVKQ